MTDEEDKTKTAKKYNLATIHQRRKDLPESTVFLRIRKEIQKMLQMMDLPTISAEVNGHKIRFSFIDWIRLIQNGCVFPKATLAKISEAQLYSRTIQRQKPKLRDFTMPQHTDPTGEKSYNAYRKAKKEYIQSKCNHQRGINGRCKKCGDPSF